MRCYDLKNTNGEIHWKKTAPEVEELFGLALIDQETLCRITGLKEWHELNEFFPTLKYQSSALLVPRIRGERSIASPDSMAYDDQGKRAKTSALQAGWICCCLGLGIAWLFPLAHFFYSVAVVLAIVCMCTHQVNRGLILLITSCVGIGVSAIVFFGLAIGAAAKVVAPAIAEHERQQAQLLAHANAAADSLRNAFAAPTQTIGAGQMSPTQPPKSRPLNEWSAAELLAEIARLEELHRASRKANRPVPKGIADKLVQTQAAYDAVTSLRQ